MQYKMTVLKQFVGRESNGRLLRAGSTIRVTHARMLELQKRGLAIPQKPIGGQNVETKIGPELKPKPEPKPEPESKPEPKPEPKKATAKKPAAKKTSAKKTTAKKPAAKKTTRKPAAKKPAAKTNGDK